MGEAGRLPTVDDVNVYAVGEGGERPGSSGSAGAGALHAPRVSWALPTSGGTKRRAANAGGVRFETAHDAQACSFCGTNGACAGWSGGKRNVPWESTSEPSTCPYAPPSTSGARTSAT